MEYDLSIFESKILMELQVQKLDEPGKNMKNYINGLILSLAVLVFSLGFTQK